MRMRTLLCTLTLLLPVAASAAASVPTITKPTEGQVIGASQGEVWFSVDSAAQVAAEEYSGCCEVEFQYRQKGGEWQANNPVVVEYPGLKGGGDFARSSVEFKAAQEWRMRVRIFKYKKEFPWSDWREFKVEPRP